MAIWSDIFGRQLYCGAVVVAAAVDVLQWAVCQFSFEREGSSSRCHWSVIINIIRVDPYIQAGVKCQRGICTKRCFWRVVAAAIVAVIIVVVVVVIVVTVVTAAIVVAAAIGVAVVILAADSIAVTTYQ